MIDRNCSSWLCASPDLTQLAQRHFSGKPVDQSQLGELIEIVRPQVPCAGNAVGNEPQCVLFLSAQRNNDRMLHR